MINQVNGNCHISYSCSMDLISAAEKEAFDPLKIELTSLIFNESVFNTR